ncbi:MAG: TIGR03668 family PPOX class F420-dependent oxidoreductase [Candidatus Dadabacteria bacterium]|nr:TIGR03668 family PPOX class F420-dependent oxidoreductase [Candidatus Dadabacteria bacterium]NIS10173.1 TIGR03668 family PPOX class F420-dependent oxidoreductase [Candidatus Dadabacteria bacterium]NIV42563.1 TIGR03668 family PPOX class F420-dependent oxidoreductase [Candidatus Dadabacteria bacterium]NIY23085.1 TIGR03668 family PPOX class F420-dependent oxidoreductase [Candidatus Dadabacteria bacterium]
MNQIDSDIIRYISRKRLAHLATSDCGGVPTVIPVCFAYHNNIVYTPLDAKPKKILPTKLKRVKNIIENPSVSFVIDEYNDDWDRLSYVLIQGTASLIDHGEEYAEALAQLCEKYEQYSKMKLADLGLPVIKIVPNKIITWGNFD